MSTEISHTLFDDLEYVKNYKLTVCMNSVMQYEVKTNGRDELCTIICGGKSEKSRNFVSLSTSDFCLSYTGKSLTLSSLYNNIEFDSIPSDVSEEWFFQLSTTMNFGSLAYEDIVFLKTLFVRRYQED